MYLASKSELSGDDGGNLFTIFRKIERVSRKNNDGNMQHVSLTSNR